ncbi:MAG: murein DD-endopeptidase MepM/ murein hydrolase activator NlpD [Rhodothermales bacterium]|jgi:murein DD-endopeptidase MepM/ murein hydrolase activator NlpD
MGRESSTCWLRPRPASAALILLLLALATPYNSRAQEDCFDNAFCLEGVRSGDGEVAIRIRNLLYGSITMRLQMELENLSADQDLPIVVTLPGALTVQPLRLRIEDQYERWGYRFDAKWIMGTLAADHDDGTTYGLPFDRGAERLVGQGYNGSTTHTGKNALDFEMPEGTKIRAAREGVVVETEDSFRVGGPDQSLKTRANFVKVQHEDGTIANYVHLLHRGVRVRLGQRVRRGEVIGASGNTGFTTGPHLHFEVYGITADLERETIPVHFLTTHGREVLLEGGRYTSPAS